MKKAPLAKTGNLKPKLNKPSVVLLVSVLIFSIWPAFLHEQVTNTNPFMFSGSLLLGNAVASGWLLIIWRKRLLEKHRLSNKLNLSKLIWEQMKTPVMLLALLAETSHLLFAFASQLVDTTVASVIHEASVPLMHMLVLIGLTTAGKRRYHRLKASSLALWLLAMVGMILVVIGASGPDPTGQQSLGLVIFGIVLALVSGFISAGHAYQIRWGIKLRQQIAQASPARSELATTQRDKLELACIMLSYCLSALVVMVISYAVGFSLGAELELSSFSRIFLGGALILFSGHLLSKWAYMKTPDLKIGALGYLTPLIALGWLILFTDAGGGSNLSLVISGAVILVGANILLARNKPPAT